MNDLPLPEPEGPSPKKERSGLTAEEVAAIEAYNEHVEKDGVFSDGLRSF